MLFMLPGDVGYAGWPCQLLWVPLLAMLFVYVGTAAYALWLCSLVVLANLTGYAGHAVWLFLLPTLIGWLAIYDVNSECLWCVLATLAGWLCLLNGYADYRSFCL